MANFSKNFTQIDNVNGGNEVELTDVPTPQMINVSLNNTQYLYNLLNAGFIDNINLSNNSIAISKKVANGTTTSLTISISDLNGYTKSQIDNMVTTLNNRASNIESSLSSLSSDVSNLQTNVNKLDNFAYFRALWLIDSGTRRLLLVDDSNKNHFFLIPFDNGANCELKLYLRTTLIRTVSLRGFVTIRVTSWGIQIYSSIDGQQSFNETIDLANPNTIVELKVPQNNHWGLVYLNSRTDYDHL